MLSILGIVVLIVAPILAYRTAKDYDRNAALWAIVTFAVGFALQFVIPFFIGIILAMVLMASGTPPDQLQEAIGGWATVIGVAFMVLSIVGVFTILRYLSKVPEEKSFTPPPRPPETFN